MRGYDKGCKGKMKTPIADFVKKYKKSRFSRFHMPGHKGKKILGAEPNDITEIFGADVLYSPDGIIAQSEDNATKIFGTGHTYYSTEGATLGIKAMLVLAKLKGGSNKILAGRNAHKSFMHACALLDLDPIWLYPQTDSHFISCVITPETLLKALSDLQEKPIAVYITSPDYLGNIADIKGLAKICNNERIPLLVDNAHGSYSAFTTPCFHPIKLGASMCVDSAHKTLPVLTGGAYLHISKEHTEFCVNARNYLSLFASTSPSYLILESLDMANKYLSNHLLKFDKTVNKVNKLKLELLQNGISVRSGEPLKLVINAKVLGYNGLELADYLRKNKIEVEMAESNYLVFMFSPNNTNKDFKRLKKALLNIEKKPSLPTENLKITPPERVLSIRQALLGKRQTVSVENCLGKVVAQTCVSCPPAVPIIISGEKIDQNTINALKRAGIKEIDIIV